MSTQKQSSIIVFANIGQEHINDSRLSSISMRRILTIMSKQRGVQL